MRKILTIAVREYRAMVATKAFVVSIAVMPILMFGGMLAAIFLQKAGSADTKLIAIFDPSGLFYEEIVETAAARNELAGVTAKTNSETPDLKKKADSDAFGSAHLTYEFEKVDLDKKELTDEERFAISEKIRKRELYAFVEIPADISSVEADAPAATFYSEDASISDARVWIESVISQRVKFLRMQELNIDVAKVQVANRPVSIQPKGLLEKNSAGEISTSESQNIFIALLMPMAIMMLMFMVIFLSSQPMLESVLEEKSQRIAEVLLGSANPFQLMSGKLLGTVAGSLTVFTIYFAGTLVLAWFKGWTQYIPFEIAPWFVVFQVLGVMFYASVFMAVGASVSQLKEAQSMLLPVWMLMMSPLFVWLFAVKEPNGSLATWFSFFPPATPTMMMLRLSTAQSIPAWQPIVGIVILSLFTLLGVFIASRIFRVGILWQGKTPRISEILRWGLFG
jgi:ABC-type Na+ efflux pump permease subunit